DYRFQTDVYGAGSVSNGTFSGTLYIKGGGDPTLGASGMRALARNLHSAGINTVKGRVLGDASIFDKLGGGPDSHYKASTETEGELSGLVYNSGFTGRSLQSNPAKSAAGAFVALAKSGGVTIAHGTTVGTGTTPANTTQLAHVYSPTLGTLIRSTNVPSNNFYAETLLKDIGHFYGTGGSTAAGAKATLSIVKSRLGVTGVQTNDGSGLSRYDRTSPAQLVTLLDEMAADPYFVGSLPVAGVSGTLKSEMRGTPAAGDCRAKTGTLRDVANLSGYCRAANGHNLVFSFMENSLHNSNTGHALEDTMAEALAEYTGDGKGSAASPMPVPTPSFAPVTSTATP
ncbi:MAG: D-alanyl-D-alanine carboxypeptidase/D-alanyl-D-alanine-endopeptidase, partial [Solirubrobacterales bacterium]|nr:D-alanyl-D-alanine carboxypeptidase/D-alanyl-D-alanine-endopeptidase [Solirubrobacterales bacterium]